jgi:hypothetical protein
MKEGLLFVGFWIIAGFIIASPDTMVGWRLWYVVAFDAYFIGSLGYIIYKAPK